MSTETALTLSRDRTIRRAEILAEVSDAGVAILTTSVGRYGDDPSSPDFRAAFRVLLLALTTERVRNTVVWPGWTTHDLLAYLLPEFEAAADSVTSSLFPEG